MVYDRKMVGATPRDVVVVPLGTYVVSELGSLEVSTDGSVGGKFDCLLDKLIDLRSKQMKLLN